MIDPKKVLQEISDKMTELEHTDTKGKITKVKNRIEFLRMVFRYLESTPNDEFLKAEIDRIQNRILLIKQGYKKWIPNKYFVKEKEKFDEYLKEMGQPKLQQQYSAIRFILDEQ